MSEDRNQDETLNGPTNAELSANLKAFEARLAALKPRSDRLDRDALLFEAGRASVQVGPRYRWAWPTALGAMTTVAAVLLAMILAQPGPQEVVKYVYVPQPAESEATADDEVRPVVDDSSTELPKETPARNEASLMASVSRGWFGAGLWQSSPRQRQLEALLAQGADAFGSSSDSANRGGERAEIGPRSYRQWRDMLLDGESGDRPSVLPTTKSLFKNGADS